MAINYTLYKTTIINASKLAREASTIDDALEIQAQGFATALQVALLSANGVSDTQVDPVFHKGLSNLVGGIF